MPSSLIVLAVEVTIVFSTDGFTVAATDSDYRIQGILFNGALFSEMLVDQTANQCGKAESPALSFLSEPMVLLRFK